MAKKKETKIVINIGQPNGQSAKVILEGDVKASLYGFTVGSELDGDVLGADYAGYKFLITGGSDRDGFPMRGEIRGTIHKKPLLTKSVGYKPKIKGDRRRKRVRGNEIQDDVAQINLKVIKEGSKPLN